MSGMEKTQKKIQKGMTDAERYELLKDRTLTVAPCDSARAEAVKPGILNELAAAQRKVAFALLGKLCKDFGIYGKVQKVYGNETIPLTFPSFVYSGNNLDESVWKQGGNYDEMGNMFTCFDAVIKNAIGIEVHGNRYYDAGSLDAMFVLVSAFSNGESVFPVKLEIKNFRGANVKAPNSLYVAVSRHPMVKATFNGHRNESSPSPQVSSSDLTISIRDFFANVNCLDEDLLKYIPTGFLSSGQLAAAERARAKERTYIQEKNAGQRLVPEMPQAEGLPLRPETKLEADRLKALVDTRPLIENGVPLTPVNLFFTHSTFAAREREAAKHPQQAPARPMQTSAPIKKPPRGDGSGNG
jgi:hypothetical protein